MPSNCAALLLVAGLSRLLDQQADDVVIESSADIGAADTTLVLPIAIATAVAAADEQDPAPHATPIVRDWTDATRGGAAIVQPARRIWVRHRVRPRERLTQIAARYGTTAEEIAADNNLDPRRPNLSRLRRIRVRASRIPPPRKRVKYVVRDGETWGDVAAKLRVERLDLHAFNWRERSLYEGRELVAWVDPIATPAFHPGEGPDIPETFDVPTRAKSVGRPQRGRLLDGVLLPESDLYTRRHPTHGLWGSSHTILQIHRAFASFRHDTGYEGAVTIGAISRRRGGRFHPHVSHQSGRDIDVRMPLLPGVPATETPNPDEIDWFATWELVEAFIATGHVDVIFLDVTLHRRLYEAARILGETPQSLDDVMQWPSWDGHARPYVRHSKGHDTHIHVRIDCGPDEPRCKKKAR